MLTGTFLTKCYVSYRCNGKLYFAFFVPRNRAEFLEMREFGSHSARSTSLEKSCILLLMYVAMEIQFWEWNYCFAV